MQVPAEQDLFEQLFASEYASVTAAASRDL